MIKLLVLLALLVSSTFAQTPLTEAKLPAYVMAGLSYNQQTGAAGFVSSIVPEINSIGMYGSATADVVPVKFTDPVTKKTIYLLSASFRGGQHKTVYHDGNNMLLIGGDFGAAFSGQATTGVSVGLAGSFTVTYIHQLNPHWAIGLPIRMLWMGGVGPGGHGAWNPVGQVGLIWKP